MASTARSERCLNINIVLRTIRASLPTQCETTNKRVVEQGTIVAVWRESRFKSQQPLQCAIGNRLWETGEYLLSQCNITLCRRWGRDKSHQAPLIERCDRDVPRSSPPFLPHSLRCHLHFVSSCRSVRLMRQFVFRPVFGRRHEADERRKPWDSPDSQT